MLRPARTSMALALVASAIVVAACGGDDEVTIPRDDGEAMLATLAKVEAQVASNDCTDAGLAASDFIGQINGLPASDVDTETKEMLRAAGQNLAELIDDPSQCGDDEKETTTTTTTESGATGFEGD